MGFCRCFAEPLRSLCCLRDHLELQERSEDDPASTRAACLYMGLLSELQMSPGFGVKANWEAAVSAVAASPVVPRPLEQ